MRIIHEICWPPQTVGGNGSPYAIKTTDVEAGVTQSIGFQVEEIMILSVNPHTGKEEDSLYIDGDAACILRALDMVRATILCQAEDLIAEGKLAPDWQKLSKRFPGVVPPEEDEPDPSLKN